MEESFTIGEVAELFHRERRTIERWVARAQMNVADDTQDGRRKLLSKAQVEHLAHLHRITLPLKTQVAGPSEAQLATLEARLSAQIAAERREREKLARRLEQLEQRIATIRHEDEQPTIKMPAVRAPEPQQTALPTPAISLPIPRQWPAESPHSATRLLTVLQFVERHLVDGQHLNAALVDATSLLRKESRSTIGRGARVKLLGHWRSERESGVQRCREGCECVDYLPS